MASGRTSRKELIFPKPTDNDTLCADQQAAAEKLDTLNEGQQDFLQAGVVKSTDWSFTATINSGTGAIGSSSEVAESVAWLPDPVVSGALMRSVTAKAALSGIAPSLLPASGKYVSCAFELTPSTWGAKATVTAHSGVEKNTEAEAIAAPPATTAGKIQVRRVIIKNTAGVYSIVAQEDVRLWATGGNVATETQAQGKVGAEAVTDAKVVKGRALVETENAYGTQVARVNKTKYKPSTTRITEVILEVSGTNEASQEVVVRVGLVVVGRCGTSRGNGSAPGSISFTCNPNEEWEFELVAGVSESLVVNTSYRTR